MSARTVAVEVAQCRRVLGHTSDDAVVFALDELRVEAGEHLALVGPSGCGKSTLLNLIAGLVLPDTGRIEVAGAEWVALSPGARDRHRGGQIGFVFQSFNLLDPFTALENVLLALKFGRALDPRERHARAVELLKRVGLGHRLDVRPGRLSVGERQRVAIARALANRPPLLLADEPTGALDPPTADSVFGLLVEVAHESGAALLMVTHDHDLADRLPRRFDCKGLVRHEPTEGKISP